MSTAEQRAEMPEGSAPILDNRSLEKDYRTLLPFVKEGMRVLDVGCGSGAISRGLAERVGPKNVMLISKTFLSVMRICLLSSPQRNLISSPPPVFCNG